MSGDPAIRHLEHNFEPDHGAVEISIRGPAAEKHPAVPQAQFLSLPGRIETDGAAQAIQAYSRALGAALIQPNFADSSSGYWLINARPKPR